MSVNTVQTITSALSERFFSDIQSTLDLSLTEMHDFYRLFFLPGMNHCAGGLGAWSIGSAQSYPYDQALLNSKHNGLLALIDWVENGSPPEVLVGTKYENDVIGSKITAQRSKQYRCAPRLQSLPILIS